MRIYPSRSEDPQKNPLDPDTKSNMMKKMFPDFTDNIINDADVKTIFDALKIADEENYSEVQIVVGSDRVKLSLIVLARSTMVSCTTLTTLKPSLLVIER